MRCFSRSSAVAIALLGALQLTACGEGGIGPPVGNDVPLWIWNRSQYELLEVYVHEGPNFEGSENLLDAPLPIDDALFIDLFPANAFLTVVRTERDLGDRYAITTEKPVFMLDEGHTLIVFDTSFRLLDPTHPDNTFWETAQ